MAGPATYDPPAVGSSGDFFWDRDSTDGKWYRLWFRDFPALHSSPVANFGAKVLAVPEPASAALLALGVLLAARKRRR